MKLKYIHGCKVLFYYVFIIICYKENVILTLLELLIEVIRVG